MVVDIFCRLILVNMHDKELCEALIKMKFKSWYLDFIENIYKNAKRFQILDDTNCTKTHFI